MASNRLHGNCWRLPGQRGSSVRYSPTVDSRWNRPVPNLSYCVFNLDALTTLAALGDRAGVNLWHFRTPDGQSIRQSLNWIASYVMSEKC